jgi:integrase
MKADLLPCEVGNVADLVADLTGRGMACIIVTAGNGAAMPFPAASVAQVKPKASPGLADAVQLCLASKGDQGLRPKYLAGLQTYLHAFARRFDGKTVDEVTTSDIELWFSERKEPPTSRNSNRGRLSALFAFAKRRGWRMGNPCDNLERPRCDRLPPEVLSPDQAETLLRTVRQHWPASLPYAVLCLLAGVRPDECQRLTWADVRLDDAVLTVSAAASKVRQRRIVRLMPACVAWLRLGGNLPLTKATRKRLVFRMKQTLGLDCWPQDLLRHTAASYLLAHHESPGKVAMMLGNSERVLLTHYRELVTAEDARRFWSIFP